jgi:FixJ family two-component response regulator
MPGMSGIELHRDLVASRCRVPVVFITAHGDDDDARSQALSDGAVAYLIKPFSEEELLEAVDASLSLHSDWKTSQ